MKRHDFIKQFAVGGSLLLATPFIFSSCSKDDETDPGKNPLPTPGNDVEIDLNAAAYSALKTVGGFAYYGDIIIIRTSETQYVALSKVCTHQGATVVYNPSNGNVVCNSHGSVFSNTGSVINGPATQALRRYTTSVNGNILTIKA